MLVSVAVATYNGERFILKQLESIYNQTEAADEVIICDDCSTDKTVEICKDFIKKRSLSNWRISVNEKNAGYCLNFYGAIEKCIGDVIFLADQDDEWHIDKIEKMLECMKKFPDITVLASRYNVIDENSDIIENSGVTYLGDVFDGSVEYLSAESFIGCSYVRGFSMCFKKEIKRFLKPIDLKSLLSHDWYICMLGAVTGKTAVLNTVLTGYRYHYDNVSLSDMTRKTFIGDPNKRIRGIGESIEAHRYIATLMNDTHDRADVQRFVRFEEKRLRFLKTKNPIYWLSLAAHLRQYTRYYKGKGLRVWLGDLAYAYRINPKIHI